MQRRQPFDRKDLLLPALLLAPSVLESSTLTERPAASAGAAAVIVLAAAVRRASPLYSLLLTSALVLFTLWLDGSMWTFLACFVLSCLAGRRGTGLGAAHAVFALTGTAGAVLVTASGETERLITLLMLGFAGCVLPWWAGDWWRQRSRLAEAGWERAERLEREQLFAAEQARLRERAHIARDIHDSLGHELSVMALLAGGLELAPDLPDRHRESAARLRERSTLAIERLHEAIGLLKDGSAGPSGETVAELIRRFEHSGTPVLLEEEGDDPGSSPIAERAVYRVVQESLTNAAKHAPGSAVAVRVEHTDEGIEVSVRSGRPEGDRPAGAAGGGSGLIGLDERVRLAGGRLVAGPTPQGFEVVARVPRTPSPAARPYDDAPADVPVLPEPGGSATALLRARTRLRRGVRRAALVPVLIGIGLVALLVGFQVATSVNTAVATADYDRMRVGQPRAELVPVLPSHWFSEPPPVIVEPAIPDGAACEYYRAGHDILQTTEKMYRLCFEDGVLVSKDVLRGGGIPGGNR
ncbi:sensor histidine kinase [Actinocorallia populi]|uniref:sensor histidine kinase n=1 Tax=Actinocorallia populi TaxID=2079200 RepID=UPI000D0927D5|nr:histidine kinase [Actinocorallia populi]